MIEDIIEIDNPTLWDIDNPVMYQLRTTVNVGDRVADTTQQRFGYRYMDWQADEGFSFEWPMDKIPWCIHAS